MNERLNFQVISDATGSSARSGSLPLSRGLVETPFFMPIGTHGAVKTVTASEVGELGAQVILSNTYHLYLRPGAELINKAGGIHKFMSWDGPLLTDSGGYQVFSLATMRKLDDDGVTFQSHLDGSVHQLTPEKVIDIQRQLGSDFVMVLDECPPGDADQATWAAALERTTAWAHRSVKRFRESEPLYGHQQYPLCIVQGGTDPDLRRRSAEELLELDTPAYAIGGLAVGEPKKEMYASLEVMDALLPRDRPRYLMGVGTPADLVRAVRYGMDMFDCVMPTRNARNGQLFTRTGKLNIKNAGFRDDLNPVEDDCDCQLCRQFSRAYLRHLFATGEVLGLRLATIHNLRFYMKLMAAIRTAIRAGDYATWSRQFLAEYESDGND
ncbi:MAG: tRNA guanosine(34) transglycosylase Tgt [Candidatus Marinimicrobia bacterium]|nr:tRNA guanosine(34) transglycosylase Tgt [Candidatus Neomarinimicrobiota bacterium]